MPRKPRVKAGHPITADDYNAIAEALERFVNLKVADGSYLRLWDDPEGKHLAYHPPVKTLALLSGSSSPYSFQEVDADASGAFVVRGVGDSCSSCVYEVNGLQNLGGKVVTIVWTDAGDWRFQWVGHAAACAAITRICVSITSDGCTNTPAYGAEVIVKDNTGATVGNCTAEGTVLSLGLGAGGSGYTDGTSFSLGFSGGGGSGAAGTFDVVSGAVTNLALSSGGSGYTSAPTVSFPGAGGGSGASAAANMGAKCCVSIPSSGSYTVETTVPGATPITSTVHTICNVDNNLSVAFPVNTLGTVCFSFTHCGYANGGDTIVISKAGTPVATVMTDGSGVACARLGTGSYTAVLTTPQGSIKNLSFSVTACTTTNVGAGFSVTRVCVGIWTGAPAGCTATVTIKNSDTLAAVGTGSLTTAFDGTIYYGQACVTISELVSGVTFGFIVNFTFSNFSDTSSFPPSPLGCYSSDHMYFIDARSAGAPC